MNFKFLIKILAIICIFLAIFGISAANSITLRKESVLALILSYIVYLFSFKIQDYWYLLSGAATRVDYFLLKIISPDAYMRMAGTSPMLGISPFIVNIGKPCSGIEGLGFFTIMSILIVLIDWNKINLKKVWIIPLGIIGMFIVNCLRITAIILIGRYISPEFATNTFHTNIGWILFILYFVVFWYFVYGWLVKKK